jgi:hypothetical protein
MCLNYLIYYPKINLGTCFAKADWEGTIRTFAKLLVPCRLLPLPDWSGAHRVPRVPLPMALHAMEYCSAQIAPVIVTVAGTTGGA